MPALGSKPRRPPTRPRGRLVPIALAGAVVLLAVTAAFLALKARRSPPTAVQVQAPPTSAPTVPAQPPTPEPSLTPREIADRALPSVVSIRCADSRGSGFFIAPETVLTNAHVVGEWQCREGIEVAFPDGRRLPGGILRREKWLDLATLKVDGANARPLAIGDALRLAAGDPVLMIGGPRGLDFTVQQGIVSNIRRRSLGLAYMQLDAHVDPGDSGGPLLDEGGRVVGVVSARVPKAEGFGLALPVNYGYGKTVPFPEVDADEKTRLAAVWQDHLDELAAEDREEAARIGQGFDHPPGGLLVAWGDGTPSITAMVGLRGSGQRPPLEVTFHVLQEGRKVCSRPYTLEQWSRPGYLEGTTLGWDNRFLQWMWKSGVKNILMSRANLQILDYHCPGVEWPRPSELLLEGATLGVDRVPVEAWNFGRDQ